MHTGNPGTRGEREPEALAGYDAIGTGHCIVDHGPFESNPRVNGVLKEIESVDANECASACDRRDHCSAFSITGSGVALCRLYSMVPSHVARNSDFDENGGQCYVKIFDGKESCMSSAREYFNGTDVGEGWADCPADQRYQLRMTAGSYASDILVQLQRRGYVPYTIYLEDPVESQAATASLETLDYEDTNSTTSAYNVHTSLALSQLRDLEVQELQVCLAPGIYDVEYMDDPTGMF
eukprot:gene17997-21435_t